MENLLPYLTNKKTVRKILNSIRKGSEGVSRSLFSLTRERDHRLRVFSGSDKSSKFPPEPRS